MSDRTYFEVTASNEHPDDIEAAGQRLWLETYKPKGLTKRTESMSRLSKEARERFQQEHEQTINELGVIARPRTRGDCLSGFNAVRPCPFVSCKYHLALDLTKRGSIVWNFPDREVWEIPQTCALDVADRGGATLEHIGELLQNTRENIRRIETEALAKLKALAVLAGAVES